MVAMDETPVEKTNSLLRSLEIPHKASDKLAQAIHSIGTGRPAHRGAPVLVAKLLNAVVKHWRKQGVRPEEIGRRAHLVAAEIVSRPYHADTEVAFTKLRTGLSTRLARELPPGTTDFRAFFEARPNLETLKHYESALASLTADLAEKRLFATR